MINIGQIRRFSVNLYLKGPLGVSYAVRQVPGTDFKDTVIKCNTLDSSKSYCLATTITKEYGGLSQKINIRLRHADINVGSSSDEVYQNLKTIVIGENATSYDVEIIFTPNAGYNQISFDLIRTDLDYGDPTRKVIIDEQKTKLYEINNIVQDLNSLYASSSLKALRQIGVRSKSGLRMCINGEEILVGPSGVYELYNGIPIKYLGFIIEESDKDTDFILDFTYEGEE